MNERYPEGTSGRELPPTLASGEGSGTPDGSLVGRILGGRYRILRKLGEGAMGAVYLGEHMKIGRQDAIKVLRDALATDPDTIARFVRGTRNVSMIRHPNICTIYDYSDTADGVQFVAMEFVPGETLRDLLQREGKLSVEVAVHIARQAAEALDAAHEVGIVHRDLKPANIMVVPGRSGVPDVKVVDFDIAKGSADGEGEEVTRMGFVVGTPEYMSPEQLIGDRLDGRSDIYSLALVLYRMLTGTLPFAAEDTQDLMVKRLTEEPMTLAAGLPGGAFAPPLEAAIRRALQRKPAERQATAAEFGRELAVAVGALQPEAAPRTVTPGVAERRKASHEPGGRRPIPLFVKAGAGVAGLVLAVAAGVFAFGGNPGEQEPPLADAGLSQEPVVRYDDPEAPAVTANDGLNESMVEDAPEEAAATEVIAAPGGSTPATATPTRPPPPSTEDLINLLASFGVSPDDATVGAARAAALEAWNHPDAGDDVRATAAFVVAQCAMEAGDRAQALAWIDRALQLQPDNARYRMTREMLVGPPVEY